MTPNEYTERMKRITTTTFANRPMEIHMERRSQEVVGSCSHVA